MVRTRYGHYEVARPLLNKYVGDALWVQGPKANPECHVLKKL